MFLENPNDQFTGSDVFKNTKLHSGTVYPLLASLVDKGWIKAEWENVQADDVNRPPPKRMYRITNCGYQSAVALLSDEVSPAFANVFTAPATT